MTDVALNAADFGFTPSASNPTAALNTAIQAAINDGLPLFIPEGTYTVGQAIINGRIHMYGVPGKVTFQLANGSGNIIFVTAGLDVTIEGINFDGQDLALSGGWTNPGLVYVQRDGAANTFCRLIDCRVYGSTANGITCRYVGGTITRCEVYNCEGAGIFSLGAENLTIDNNVVRDCPNNGILIWQAEAARDNTIVTNNRIFGIGAALGGTGQWGNGVNIFRAQGVIVANNVIENCEYSAVRANAASDITMVANNCRDIREVALYFEHTGSPEPAGAHTAVINDNIVEDCATGVSITNYNNDGRLAVCSGNVIRRCQIRPDAPDDRGVAIAVEADTIVSNNIVEDCEVAGIVGGTGDFTRNIIITGNLVQNYADDLTTQAGIAVSGTAGAGHELITNNMVRMKPTRGAAYGLVALDYNLDIIMNGTVPREVTTANFSHITVSANVLFDT